MSNRILILAALVTACSSTTPPAETPTQSTASAETSTAATRPDTAKLERHLREHVSYPASRADVLAACAATPEFSDGEKQWATDNLPEGNYQSADDVIGAFGI